MNAITEAAATGGALVDPGSRADISPLDLKEIQTTTRIAVAKENDMKDLCKEVGEMNFLKLFWDAKVPENKKSFFNRIAFKFSDPKVMQGEIKKYLEFYTQMKTVMQVVRSSAMGSDDDVEDIILELYECLREMAEKARSLENSSDSKILCELHNKFVAEHEKIEYRIRRVESGALRRKQKVLTQRWEDALKTIETLSDNLRKAEKEKEDMAIYLQETLAEQDQKWESYRKEMLLDNRKTVELLQKKEEENDKFMKQQDQLLEENKEIKTLLQKLLKDRQ